MPPRSLVRFIPTLQFESEVVSDIKKKKSLHILACIFRLTYENVDYIPVIK